MDQEERITQLEHIVVSLLSEVVELKLKAKELEVLQIKTNQTTTGTWQTLGASADSGFMQQQFQGLQNSQAHSQLQASQSPAGQQNSTLMAGLRQKTKGNWQGGR